MGANILWKPVKPEGVSLPIGGRSSFIEAFRRKFGNEPWTLERSHVGWLEGFQAASREDKAIEDLIEAIEKHSIIEVWPQY